MVHGRQRVAVVVVPVDGPHAQHHVSLLGGPVHDDERFSPPIGRLAGRAEPTGRARETGLDAGQDAVVVEPPGRGHHDVGRPVVVPEEGRDLVTAHGRDGVLFAQHLSTQWVAGEQRLGEDFVDEVGRLVAVHQDLFEDHLPLRLDLVGPEGGRPHDVAQDVEPEVEVVAEHPDVERRVLLGGEGVDVAADGVDRFGDVLG